MSTDEKRSFLDGKLARVIAGVIVVACMAAIYHLQRNYGGGTADEMPAGVAGSGQVDLSPEFVKCRDERVGQVEKMLSEGVINQAKFGEFKARAIATCAGQFPPGG